MTPMDKSMLWGKKYIGLSFITGAGLKFARDLGYQVPVKFTGLSKWGNTRYFTHLKEYLVPNFKRVLYKIFMENV